MTYKLIRVRSQHEKIADVQKKRIVILSPITFYEFCRHIKMSRELNSRKLSEQTSSQIPDFNRILRRGAFFSQNELENDIHANHFACRSFQAPKNRKGDAR